MSADTRKTRWRALSLAVMLFMIFLAVGAVFLYAFRPHHGTKAAVATGLSKTILLMQTGLHTTGFLLESAAAGLHAGVTMTDNITLQVYLICKGPFAKVEQALGIDTWSQPVHDIFIGCVVSVLYILFRHYSVLWNRALPAVTDFFIENWIWPGPLRRRKTRKLVFKRCRDMLCIICGLVAFCLLMTNSAAPPSPVADKWFATPPRSHLQTAADKQAASTHLAHQQSPLQMGTYLATNTYDTCPVLTFAERCIPWMRKVSKQNLKQSQPNATAVTPAAPVLLTPAGIAPGPRVHLTASSAGTTARMPAPSRALVLVPRLPVCPAVFSSSVLIAEAQHTLTVHPVRPVLNFLGQASACMTKRCSMTTPAAADNAVTPSLPDLACNDTLMCCLVGSLTQPPSAITIPRAASVSAALGNLPKHSAAGSPYTAFLPDLRSLSWLQTLFMAAFMFSLGFVMPGVQVWWTCGGMTPDVGAAIAAASDEPMSMKLERAGMKAGRTLKRTTSTLITTRWTGDHATTPAFSPSAASLLVQQDQHSLVDADSILARDVPNLRAAAALEQIHESASEAILPAEANSCPRAAAGDESAAAAALHPTPTQPDPAALAPQHPAPLEHAPAMDSPEPSSAGHAQTTPTAQPAPTAQLAPAAVEPALDAGEEPAELGSPAPHQAAVPAKPESGFQPARVQVLPTPPKAALPVTVSQGPLPQAAPAAQAGMRSNHPLAKEGTVCENNEDKVVSSGCWGTFCCFKAGRRENRGIFGRRK